MNFPAVNSILAATNPSVAASGRKGGADRLTSEAMARRADHRLRSSVHCPARAFTASIRVIAVDFRKYEDRSQQSDQREDRDEQRRVGLTHRREQGGEQKNCEE
jgi:hypothetical protein